MIWSPLKYREAAAIAREAGEELFSRLEWMTIKPRVIVDVGCGLGEMSSRLQARFPDAKVIGLDLSEQMLQHSEAKTALVCGAANTLPLRDQSVDLIFANFLIPWCLDAKSILQEWRRVLRPDGLLLFTALGPDTMKEWRHIFSPEILPVLIDMHEIGDWMLTEKFADPVLDIHHYTLTYSEQTQLLNELHASGMLALLPILESINEVAIMPNNKLAVSNEVIFAHAFMPAVSDEISPSEDGMVRVPLSYLRRQLRSS